MHFTKSESVVSTKSESVVSVRAESGTGAIADGITNVPQNDHLTNFELSHQSVFRFHNE